MSGGGEGNDLVRQADRTVSDWLPVLAWLPRYRRSYAAPDVIAGIAVAALLIPEAIGYAGIAGVPPEVGLYSAVAAAAAYALAGGTSLLVVGPASAVAAMSAAITANLSVDADPVAVAAALAIVSGAILLLAGALRLGWIVNFVSRPVLGAFVAGLCISIVIGQLDSLLGTELEGESALTQAASVIIGVGDWQWLAAGFGLATLMVLYVLERWAPRVPAALVVVATSILLVWALGLDDGRLPVLGEIPQGLPVPAVPDLGLAQWLELTAGATALVLVGFSETVAAATAVVSRTGEHIDGDQELVGTGVANLTSGLLGGLAVSGSLSKSAAAQAAGAKTQVSNLVAALVVVATLLVIAPAFELLPEPVVAAVVIVAVLPAADPRRVLRLWRVNRPDFAAGATTFVLALVWEALPAMVVGVLLSLAFLVRRASFPDVVELSGGSDVAVIRFEAPLVYANAERLGRALSTVLAERPDLTRVVLDAEMVADLDADGADALVAADDLLAGRGIELRLARVHRRARAQLDRSALAGRFAGRTYEHIADARR